MVKKMLAAINYGPEKFVLEEIDVPRASGNEIIAKVLSAGICGSDVKCFQGKNPVPTPVIPGHEFCAEVVELGKFSQKKHGLNIGDKVVSEQIIPCHECFYCERGMYWLCKNNRFMGLSGQTLHLTLVITHCNLYIQDGCAEKVFKKM